MIEVLPDMPEGVTGIRVSGRLRADDLREFKPAMDELLKTGEIRIVEVTVSCLRHIMLASDLRLYRCGVGAALGRATQWLLQSR
jgi:hypothetical protein